MGRAVLQLFLSTVLEKLTTMGTETQGRQEWKILWPLQKMCLRLQPDAVQDVLLNVSAGI